MKSSSQLESDSHPMSKPVLAVGLEADADRRAIIKDALGDAGDAVYLMDMEEAERRVMMTTADAVFIGHTRQLPGGCARSEKARSANCDRFSPHGPRWHRRS